MTAEEILKATKAVGLTVAILATWWLQQQLTAIGVAAYSVGAAIVLVATFVCAPLASSSSGGRWSIVAGLVAIAAAIFCRLSYLWSVPSGFTSEPLAFLYFARRLVNEGFPYIPYAWYAHTLYSYWIALWVPLFASDVDAYRVANAALSIVTVGMLYVGAARLFGRRAAWISTGLLAASWWHLWASRNGYHQQLMPLIQVLYLYGVVVAFGDSPWRGFATAAVAMVLALHAYWGLYLLLPLSPCVAVYVWIFHRDSWRRGRSALLVYVFAAIVCLVPLAVFLTSQLQIFQYVRGIVELPSANTSNVGEKRLDDARYIFWALSGHHHAPVVFGSVVDPLAACAAVIGLGVSLRRSRRSCAHAILLMLFAVNVAGLVMAIANYFYITALLASVYLFAGIGLAAVVESWEGWLPRSGMAAQVAVAALLIIQGSRDYHSFFFEHVATDLRSPAEPAGRAFALLDAIRNVPADRAVFLPIDEPGRDFDTQIFDLAERIPAYDFVRHALPFDATRLMFPEALVGTRSVVAFLPNEPFAPLRVLPMLRLLYPNVEVEELRPAEPYLSINSKTIAFRVEIPAADLHARQGLPPASENPSQRLGLIVAPRDGVYRFRGVRGSEAVLRLHDRPLVRSDGIFLEAGLHPIQIDGWSANENCPLEWQFQSGRWENIGAALVNSGGVDAEKLTPYLAHVGRRGAFYYAQTYLQEQAAGLRDAELADDGASMFLQDEELLQTDERGAPRSVVKFPGVHDGWLVSVNDRVQVVDVDGNMLPVVDGKAGAAKRGPCQPVALARDGTGSAFLCNDATVVDPDAPAVKLQLQAGQQPLLSAKRIARYGDEYALVDAQASEVLRYRRDGQLVSRTVLPHLWGESGVTFDSAGNLYVRQYRLGTRAYSPDGALLLHPLTGLPSLFTVGERLVDDSTVFQLLTLRGEGGLALIPGGYQRFQRRWVDDRAG